MSRILPCPEPAIASRKPYLVELRANRSIAWCRCGRSKRQPFCDGRSHDGTGFEPLVYRCGGTAEEVLLCGCKHTGTPPFCDGTHSNLPGGYSHDLRTDEERERIPLVGADSQGVRQLDGHCCVIAPVPPGDRPAGAFASRVLVDASRGAIHQALVHLTLRSGSSPVYSGSSSDLIIWVFSGRGAIQISGRDFDVTQGQGVYVRAGEAFRLTGEGPEPITAYVSICPGAEALAIMPEMPANFDRHHPRRVIGIDAAQRKEMGPRYFQMLVDRRMGLTTAAQFVGHIPPSRAEMHRHLYEEVLIILSGRGVMWNEGSRAEVMAGDVIFLPRKQAHLLECVDRDGMDVVGVIHPGDNPGINY